MVKNLQQIKEIKENWIGLENFDNCFWVIFDPNHQRFIPERDVGHLAISLSSFGIFLIFFFYF